MLILIDARIPDEAKLTLSEYGETIELRTEGITYEAISGHPDIFFFKGSSSQILAAPNLPDDYFSILSSKGVKLIKGEMNVGAEYPASAHYNAVSSPDFFIHNTRITDPVILESYAGAREVINVNQGYCRCSLIALDNNSFITSDKGIYKKLLERGLSALFVSSEEVRLPGFPNGFIGGAFGIHGKKLFALGSLKYLKDGSLVSSFAFDAGYEIVELYDGPLFDGGSIIFI